jgi:hypothetical protein
MTDWKKVQGSQAEKPAEFDTTSSEVVVYQRRNIERITVENPDGTTAELWQYDERELTNDEYQTVRADEQQEQIDKNRSDIDFISAMTDVDLDE